MSEEKSVSAGSFIKPPYGVSLIAYRYIFWTLS